MNTKNSIICGSMNISMKNNRSNYAAGRRQ